MKMRVSVGVSNRHVHLTEETYKKLFDCEFTKKSDLNQIGEFASNQTLTIKTSKTEIENVRVLGPFRNYDQVEISSSDARKLGINPPIRNSGELDGAEKITLVTEKGSVEVAGCIIARRHVHMNPADAKKYGVKNLQEVKLLVDGIKGGSLNSVVKVSDNGFYEAHIDTDEASAFGLNSGDVIDLEIKKVGFLNKFSI